MAFVGVRYEDLPETVKNNLTEEQFDLAKVDVVETGEMVPETTEYIDLATGVRRTYRAAEIAPGDLLPTHDLSGAHGKDNTQWTA